MQSYEGESRVLMRGEPAQGKEMAQVFLRLRREMKSCYMDCRPFHWTVRLGLSAARNSAGERMRSAECGWTVL